jgi:hypothetical protein
MIKGVSVDVYTPTANGTDRFGNAIYTSAKTTVDNVLVVPGATSELDVSRPEGVQVAYTLHFPKTFSASLEGCVIELPAPWTGTYSVIGCPTPYIEVNTPTPWYMPVEIEAAHG